MKRLSLSLAIILLALLLLHACASPHRTARSASPTSGLPVASGPPTPAAQPAPGGGRSAMGAPTANHALQYRGAAGSAFNQPGADRPPAPHSGVAAADAAAPDSRVAPTAGLPPRRAGEELWVIARGDWDGPPVAVDAPPLAGLTATPPHGGAALPLPLAHTDVQADVTGYIASVRVRQQYQNPYKEKIEALYVFPLPQDAAVSDFVMTVGTRRIRGIIRERAEAERLYVEARGEGYVASLLTQERPNIFTQAVANIEPGRRIDIDLTYFHALAYHDGEYELVFPMVVGPRFNPPGADGIGAAPRGQHGSSGQATEVQYLPPGERSGHDIGLRVDLDAGMAITAITSPTHVIETTAPSPSRRRVVLHRADRVPNKDFVLRYRLAGDAVKSAFLTHTDTRGGYFTLMLQPPASLAAQARAPMELIFVLDCSGSMSGEPLAIAKRAAARALRRLGPDDTFQIIQFSEAAAQLGPAPLPATEANLQRGLAYLASLESEGGTMMIEGIKAALDFAHDPRRLRVVSFMTDGYIGNDAEILAAMQQRLGSARVFSFGIGSSTNRYLLDHMAMLGRGAVAYVGLDEGSQRAVDQFYERVSHPALTDLEIDWGGLEVAEVYPSRLPDLFVGRPVVITGRFRGGDPTTVRVRGRAAGAPQVLSIAVEPTATTPRPALAQIWARTRIADLEEQAARVEPSEPADQQAGKIRQVALEYGLMSAYTAFLAVDSSQQTAGGHGTTVVQPVPMPEGVRYDTTVPEQRAAR